MARDTEQDITQGMGANADGVEVWQRLPAWRATWPAWGFGLAAVLFVLLAAGYVLTLQQRMVEARSSDSLQRINLLVAQDLDRTLYAVEQIFAGVDMLMSQAGTPHAQHDAMLNPLLLDIQARNPFLMDLLVLNPEGEIVHWTGQGVVPRVRDRDYAAAHLDAPRHTIYIGGPHLSRVHAGQWFFGVSQSFFKEGALSWVVVGIINLDYFQQHYAELRLPEGAQVGFIDEQGRLYTRFPQGRDRRGEPLPAWRDRLRGGAYARAHQGPQYSFRHLNHYPLISFVSRRPDALRSELAPQRELVFVVALVVVGLFLWSTYRLAVHRYRAQRASERLSYLAAVDPLTGAYNRRYFLNMAEREVVRAQRHQLHMAVLVGDVDHFKAINDAYGHDVGDQVLMAIVSTMRAEVRRNDIICRYGGEEFALLLPETDLAGGKVAAENMRKAVERCHIATYLGSVNATISFGVSRFHQDDVGIEPALLRADQALYLAKDAGRNCVQTLAGSAAKETQTDS